MLRHHNRPSLEGTVSRTENGQLENSVQDKGKGAPDETQASMHKKPFIRVMNLCINKLLDGLFPKKEKAQGFRVDVLN